MTKHANGLQMLSAMRRKPLQWQQTCKQGWTYINFTLQCCSDDFQIQNTALGAAVFNASHTGENTKMEMIETLSLFDLHDGNVIYVIDQGSNIVSACKLASAERYGLDIVFTA